jgi:hypothetical protein
MPVEVAHCPNVCACPWPWLVIAVSDAHLSTYIYPLCGCRSTQSIHLSRQIVLSYFETTGRQCAMDRGSVWSSWS